MFILIFEDGKAMKSNTVSEDDKCCADAGILDIIRVEDLKSYYDGDWHDIEEVK
jgi:hypothetical protein